MGTVTEIYDYLRLLYARVGRPHCPTCGRPISGQSVDSIVEQILALPDGTRFTVNAPVVRDRKGEFRDIFESLRSEGFSRIKVDGEQHLLEEPPVLDKKFKHTIEVIVDRLVQKDDLRTRLTQSVETALQLADGLVTVDLVSVPEDENRRRRRRSAARAARTARSSRAPSTASRCPSCSRASSRSTRRTAPAHAAPGSARSRRSTPTCSSPTRACRSTTARSCPGRSAAPASTSRSSRRSPTGTRCPPTCRGRSSPRRSRTTS